MIIVQRCVVCSVMVCEVSMCENLENRRAQYPVDEVIFSICCLHGDCVMSYYTRKRDSFVAFSAMKCNLASPTKMERRRGRRRTGRKGGGGGEEEEEEESIV